MDSLGETTEHAGFAPLLTMFSENRNDFSTTSQNGEHRCFYVTFWWVSSGAVTVSGKQQKKKKKLCFILSGMSGYVYTRVSVF